MGKQEEQFRKLNRKRHLQQILLGTVKVAGALSVALLAPNALKVFKQFGLTPKPRQKEIIKIARGRLIRAGLLVYEDGVLSLTNKGELKLRQLEAANFSIWKPKKWDQKWRMLIFDIPEKRKGLRDKVRNTLVSIGFRYLQHSVWVYPYPCDDLIALLKADFRIGQDLLYLIVESVENDEKLRQIFGLKPSEF